VALITFACGVFGQSAKIVEVANFNEPTLDDWSHKKFAGFTAYSIVKDGVDSVLSAKSNSSASGLYLAKRVDLTEYPYINWRWKISRRLSDREERLKQGDDFAARVYLVVSGGMFFWKTRAISYVWSNRMAKGSEWPNAFAGASAMMHSVRTKEDAVNTWYSEKRNLLEDMRRIHGQEIRYIDVLALMSDTDNAGGSVEAWYDDIYFSKQ